MNLPIPIFRNEINALGDFKGGVKVARDFAANLTAGRSNARFRTTTDKGRLCDWTAWQRMTQLRHQNCRAAANHVTPTFSKRSRFSICSYRPAGTGLF